MELNSDLIHRNNDLLMLLNNKCLKRRVKRELENLYKFYRDITVSTQPPNGMFGIVKITICEIIENKRYKYEFVINEHYPFRGPKIFYQNSPYINYLKIDNTKNYIQILKQITGKECFCCSSYNCSSNWSPAVTIHKIIEEIYRVRQTKRNVIYKILADKIKTKYLIEDIHLDCWLF